MMDVVESLLSRIESNPNDLLAVWELEQHFPSDKQQDLLVLLKDAAGEGHKAGNNEYSARLCLEGGRISGIKLQNQQFGAAFLGKAAKITQKYSDIYREAQLLKLAVLQDWDRLNDFFPKVIQQNESNPSLVARLYLRMGNLLENPSFYDDPDGAFEAYNYAGTLDPALTVAWRYYQQLALRFNNYAQYLTGLYSEYEYRELPEQRRNELEATVKDVWKSHPEDATAYYEKILLSDPSNEHALSALQEIRGDNAPPMLSLADEPVSETPSQNAAPQQDVPYIVAADNTSLQSDPSSVSMPFEAVEESSPEEFSGAAETIQTAQSTFAPADEPPQEEQLQVEEVSRATDEGMIPEPEDAAVSSEPVMEPPYDAHDIAADAEEGVADDASSSQSEETIEEVYEEEELERATDEGMVPESEDEAVSSEPIMEPPYEEPETEEQTEEPPSVDESNHVEEGAPSEQEVEELAAQPEAVAASPEGIEGQLQPLLQSNKKWERRVAAQLQSAQDASRDEAELRVVRAFRVAVRHQAPESTLLLIWKVAVQKGCEAELYEQTHFLTVSESFWRDALSFTSNQRLRGYIAFVNLQDRTLAQEYAATPDVAQLLEDADAANDNWRKAQREFKKRFENLDDDTATYKLYWLLSDLATAERDDDKEIEALRRLERSVDGDGRVKSRLKRAYARTDNWQMFVTLLKKEIEGLSSDDVDEKADLLREQVMIYRDKIPHDSMLVNTYKEVLELDPEDIDTIDALIGLYEKLNRASDLVSTLQLKAELVSEPSEKVKILIEIATLFNERFRNKMEATKAFEAVLEIEPQNDVALEFLSEIYEQRREWEKLIDVKKRKINSLPTDDEKAQGIKEVAQLMSTKIRDNDIITGLWLEVRAYNPDDREALDALEQLYDSSRDYERLSEILDLKASLATSPEDKLELFQKQGMLFSNQLNDTSRAIEAWKNALAIDPNDLKNRKALERLLISAEQWDELEAFYADSASYEASDLVRLLETLAGTAKDQNVKIELLLRAARIWRDELNEVGRAERDLGRVLEMEPRNGRAAELLLPIYRDAEKFNELGPVLEIVLDSKEEPEERRFYQLKLAELFENQLDDRTQAFRWYAEAFLSMPEADDLVALEKTAKETDKWQQLVQTYRRALKQELPEETEMHLRGRLARVLAEELSEFDAALEQLDAILAVKSEDQKALKVKESIFRRTSRWDELNDVYKRQLELVEVPEERVEILYQMGEISFQYANNPSDATNFFKQSLEINPDYYPALRALHQIYDIQGQSDELAEVIRREITLINRWSNEREQHEQKPVDYTQLVNENSEYQPELFRPNGLTDDEIDELIELHYVLGVVSKERLNDPKSAVDNLSLVLKWRPDHATAADELEGLLSSTEHSVDVARALTPTYKLHGKWEKLIKSLGIQYDFSERDEQEQILQEIGRVYLEELGLFNQAYASYAQLLKLRPDSIFARKQMERIANVLGNWPSVVTNYEMALERVEDEELRKSYYFVLGEIQSEHLEKPDEAKYWFEQALNIEPDSDRALDALQNLFFKEARWEDLNQVLERKLEKETNPTQRQLLIQQAALLWEEKLNQPSRAIDLYQQILSEDPNNLEILRSIGTLYEIENQWFERVENLEREIELCDPTEVLEVQNQLAWVLYEHQDNPERAIDLYEVVLNSDPNNRRARAALEEAMLNDTYVNGRVSRILAPYYIERQEWTELAQAIEVQASTSDSEEERVDLLHKVASLYDNQLDDAERSFDAYARSLRYDLANENTLEALYSIAQAQNNYRGLVTVFENLADDIHDPDAKRDLLRRAAAIYHEVLEQTELAIEKLREVVSFFPDDLESINDLEALYHARSDWENLVEISLRKSEIITDDDERIQLLMSTALMYDEFLHQPLQAIDAYNRILMLDSNHLESLGRLERLYRDQEMWDELLGNYQRRAELTDDDAERIQIYYEMASVYRDRIEQPYEAIETLKNVLSIDPNQASAWAQLDALYVETEQWADLLPTLESRIELRESDEEWFEFKYRIGKLQETELFNILDAIQIYEEILSVDPNHHETKEALESLIQRGDHAVEAGRVLAPVYEQLQEWDALIHVHRLLIETTSTPEGKLELYNRVLLLEEEQKNDPAAAFETALQALEVDPQNDDTLDTLERIARYSDGWMVLITRLDHFLGDTSDFVAIRKIHLRIARMLEDEVQNVQSAIERYQTVLDVEPDDAMAISALDRLYQKEGRWEDLSDILQSRILNANDPEEVLELRLRLGNLYGAALDEPEQAIATYQEILYDDSENQHAIHALEQMLAANQAPEAITEILEPYYRDRNNYESLINLYVQRLEQVSSADESYEIWIQLATTFEEHLQDRESALGSYGRALAEKPSEVHLIPQILQIAEEENLWANALQVFQEALATGNAQPEEAIELYAELGNIQKERFGAYDDAEVSFLHVLNIDDQHKDALKALDEIYLAQEKWEPLADVLERRVEDLYDEDLLVELKLRLAEIYQFRLHFNDRAVATYQSILDILPSHEDSLERLAQLFYESQDWAQLFDVYERQSENTYEPEEQVDYYSRMAQLADEVLDRPDDAVDLWNRVLSIQPENLAALEQLRRLYQRDGRWSELVGVLETEERLVEQIEHKVEVNELLARIWDEELGNEGQAIITWRHVLDLAPLHFAALSSLHRLYANEPNFEELSGIVYRLIQHPQVNDEARLDLWREQARLQTEMLMQAEPAIDAWMKVLEFVPNDHHAISELENLLVQEGRWEDAAHVLERKAQLLGSVEEQTEQFVQIAQIYETHLQDRQRAAEAYRYILEIDPRNEHAGTALENIYVEENTPESYTQLADLYLDRSELYRDDPEAFMEARRKSARVFEETLDYPEGAFLVMLSSFDEETMDDHEIIPDLERLASATGNWNELVTHCDELLQKLGGTYEAAKIHKIVGMWRANHLSEQRDMAVYHFQVAYNINPEDVEIVEQLEILYRELEAWLDLANILHKRVEMSPDPEEKIEVHRKLGELYEYQINDLDQAIDSYSSILAIEPSDIIAIESLERIYETTQRWDQLVEIKRQKTEATYDPEQLIHIRNQIAQIQEEYLQDPVAAVDTYRDILAVDQMYLPALDQLERLYAQLGDWDHLAEVYEQKIQTNPDPDAQIETYVKQASLYENQFEDPDRTIEAYQNILMVMPEDLNAIENLERIYIAFQRWFDLVDTYQRHVSVSQLDDASRAAVYVELGNLHSTELQDVNAAIEAYQHSLQYNAEQPAVLEELSILFAQNANWNDSIQALWSKLDLITDPDERVDTLYRIAWTNEVHLQNDEEAARVYSLALEAQPQHEASLAALDELYQRHDQPQHSITILQNAERAADVLATKSKYFAKIGQIYNFQLEDKINAAHYFEQAIEADPNNLEAIEPLLDIEVNEKRWERALTLLERLFSSDKVRTPEEEHLRYYQLAKAYENLNQKEKALAAYRRAYEYNSNHTNTLRGLATALYEDHQTEKALSIYHALLENHIDELADDEVVSMLYNSGTIYEDNHNLPEAIRCFHRTLEFDAHHIPSIQKLISVLDAQQQWADAIEYRRYLLDAVSEPLERFAILRKIGQIYSQQLFDPAAATQAYLMALDVEPNSISVLRQLLKIYQEQHQHPESIEMLLRMIDIETDPLRKAKFYYTIALIYRDKLQDQIEAVKYFDLALDQNSRLLEAFEAIDRIHTDRRDWKALERSYRKMLKRISSLPDSNELVAEKILLWSSLGEVYRSRLDHIKSAIQSFEMVIELNPDDQKTRLILAELYDRSGDNPDGAIVQHKELIKINNFRTESYRALWKAYMQNKEYDKAWCMAGALTFLNSASSQEKAFYDKYLGNNLKTAKGTISHEMWKLLYHPEQDRLMSVINQQIAQGLIAFYSRPIKDWGVHKKRNLLDENTIFHRIYSYCVRTEGVVAPRVFLKPDQALGMRNMNADPPAFIIGGDMVQAKSDRELAFIIAKQVCLARPEHYLASIGLPTEYLKAFFMTAMHMADPSLNLMRVIGEAGQQILEEYQQMPPTVQMSLQKQVKTYLNQEKNPNLSAWMTAVDHTSTRLGLLLCGDLQQAADCLKNDTNPIGKTSVKEKVSELVLFAISDEYFSLRQQLGLSIDSK